MPVALPTHSADADQWNFLGIRVPVWWLKWRWMSRNRLVHSVSGRLGS